MRKTTTSRKKTTNKVVVVFVVVVVVVVVVTTRTRRRVHRVGSPRQPLVETEATTQADGSCLNYTFCVGHLLVAAAH